MRGYRKFLRPDSLPCLKLNHCLTTIDNNIITTINITNNNIKTCISMKRYRILKLVQFQLVIKTMKFKDIFLKITFPEINSKPYLFQQILESQMPNKKKLKRNVQPCYQLLFISSSIELPFCFSSNLRQPFYSDQ